jgi:hypothetical protein
MAADIDNVKLGPCSVKFNSVDVGHTKGGVTVSYEAEYHDITVDKYGNTIADSVLLGESLKVTVPLAESTIANMLVAIPNATTAGGGDRATIGKDAGARMSAVAAELVLHPLANDASDLSEDVVLHKAFSKEGIEWKYAPDGERMAEAVFHALLDENKTSGNRLGFLGDSTAT